MTDLETRIVVLGHIQRGGSPTAEDRILGGRLGAASVELLVKGGRDRAVGVVCNKINVVALEEAVRPYTLETQEDLKLIKILT
jgi:6-phosphofructokinase 1